MNRFEALGAPPTLSPKELSMHMKMIPSSVLSPSCERCMAAICLIQRFGCTTNWTTLRFPAHPGAEESSKLYHAACKLLTHATGEPIPYRFFQQEF